MSEPVTLTVGDGVAHLALNRPEANNAIDAAMAAGLRARAEHLLGRDDVRAVLLTANGRMFCPGGDLEFVRAAGDGAGEAIHGLAVDVHASLVALDAIDAVVITAVQGMAAGGGFGLALCGDIVLIGASAKLTLAYTKSGLSPDAGATWMLPRLVGPALASKLAILNPVLPADEAARLGLVTEVVPDAELAATAERLARELAAGPARAFAATRRLLRTARDHTFPEHLDLEAASIGRQAGGPEGREGLAAFLEKRAPRWT